MNLHRIIISEGAGEQLVGLTLDEIIRDGKVTNPYQNFVLGWLSEFFREGVRPTKPGLRNPGMLGATSTAVVENIKSLTDEEAVRLAKFLRATLDQSEKLPWGTNLSQVEFMQNVLTRQD